MFLRLGRFIVDFQNRFSCRGAAFDLSFIVNFQNRFLCRRAAFDLSPAFQRRERPYRSASRGATVERPRLRNIFVPKNLDSTVAPRLWGIIARYPALKRRAKIKSRSAAGSSAVPKLVKSGRTISDIFLSAIFLSATLILCSLAACAISVQAQDADYQTAVSFVQQGQFDRAFPLLQRILDRSPNDLKARNLMGIALSAAGRREEANEQFKKVLALKPKFVPALKNLALNEMALGKAQDAKIHFEEALKSAPQDTACRWGLAEIAFAARDYKRAALNYEQSGDLAWKDSRTTIKFATSCLEDGQPAKAATILEKIPATLP